MTSQKAVKDFKIVHNLKKNSNIYSVKINLNFIKEIMNLYGNSQYLLIRKGPGQASRVIALGKFNIIGK